DRQRGAAGLLAGRALAAGAAHAVDQPVADEEDQRPDQQSECDPAFPGRGVERLLDELERDGADQHAGAEGHDQPQHAPLDADPERDEAADDERRARDQPPEERCAHQRRPAAARRSNSVASSTAEATMTLPRRNRLSRIAAAVPSVPYVEDRSAITFPRKYTLNTCTPNRPTP